MTPKQHREHAADLIVERARYGGPSVLRYLEEAGIEHTVEDAKAIFALIGTATINVWFPGHRAPMSHPYARALLAENDRLNDQLGEAMSILAKVGDAISPTGERPGEALGTLVQDVEALVDQRDTARREANAAATKAIQLHHRNLHLEAELAKLSGAVVEPHPWQEYNEHGYLCHYPGCRLTPDEHVDTSRST